MADTSVQIALGRAKINEDLRVLAADTQELMRLTASATGEQLDVLRGRLNDRLVQLKGHAASASDSTKTGAKQAANSADDYVRANPWQSVGMGVAVGLILGAILAR